MRCFVFRFLSFLVFFMGIVCATYANVRPARIFGSNMVLQQGQENPIWGWADKGEKITIRFAGKTIRLKANSYGAWSSKLPALEYGGPYEMVISGTNTVTFDNVLIGEVWICSGQSNMEFTVSNVKNAKNEIASADFPRIRLFTVVKKISQFPLQDLDEGEWMNCTPENIREFSSVAFFFGRSLYQELNIPVGLIQASWGGTVAEAWISARAIENDTDFKEKLQELNAFDLRKNEEQKIVTSRIIRKEIGSRDMGLNDGIAVYADSELKETGWVNIDVSRSWEENGFPYINGIGWYRLTLELTEGQAKKGSVIHLGNMDDVDITWVNGVKVGSTDQCNKKRVYHVPANALKPGKNVIAIHVEDRGGAGGLSGDPKDKYLKTGNKKVCLNNGWKFKLTEARSNYTEIDQNYFPTLLFNGMINPVIPFGIKGVIWYQGESNVDRAKQYQRIFPNLITDWRNNWNQGNFPFLFVSLANYQKPVASPSESNWAELREAQSMALTLPNTGMALAIDLGEESDIHPRNKQEVGRRLALSALKISYGKDIVSSGPVYQSVRFEGKNAIISLSETGTGLSVRNKYGYINGFSISGADHHFVWAKAFISGNHTVLVYSDEIKNPVAVRYGWANNPDDLNLYNKEGLPAVPFRTDNWPGITK
jgi:sialate O-acetylesterase